MRLATAIVLYAIAFAIFNVGTRSPMQLVRDVGNGFRNGPILRRGLAQCLAGVLAIGIGSVILSPVTDRAHSHSIFMTLTVLTALIVEQLVGPDLRARYR